MIKTKLTEMLGIKYPIIQAGMGPFSNNNLCVASANAGVLGLLSTSGLFNREIQPLVYEAFVKSGEASMDDNIPAVLETVLKRTYRLTREKGGIFGINVMVSAELLDRSTVVIDTAIKVLKENPDMKNYFKVIFTSAGDPVPWKEKIKGAGFTWFHVVPSVKGALRCKKAGVDLIVASGHEGGFHIAWEPVHSMVLLPSVVDAMAGSGIPVVGAGGFCDGRTLAAALALGAEGVQMGTRFLATQESDFHPVWKEQVVKTGDRGTLVARGIVGPARWLKTENSIQHQKNTLVKTPNVYLDTPDDASFTPPAEFIQSEREAINAICRGDIDKGMVTGGECSQRIQDLPTVQNLVDRVMIEAEATIKGFSKYVVNS
ncbi:MAG: nitronate monooxygenase [Dehalococcoidales bacterium]|nr:nitronate monooxygenase [Dehalococcoidales bacterium]